MFHIILARGDKADMPAVIGVAQGHAFTDLARSGQTVRRHNRVIGGIQNQGRHGNTAHELFGRRFLPVVLGIFEPMQRCGEVIVHVEKITRSAHLRHGHRQFGKLFEFEQGFLFERAEKIAHIHALIKAAL